MIEAITQIGGNFYKANLRNPIDISIPMQSGDHNPNAFHIPMPRFEPIRVGDFVGSVAAGSGANCENLMINAHGNGTHTECIGHITPHRVSIHDTLKQFYFSARLVSVQPETLTNGDKVLSENALNPISLEGVEALIMRTLPNVDHKKVQNHSGQNPCYLLPALVSKITKAGIKHLLVDLPSVDREEDGGKMLAHKAFWLYPENPRMDATITELIYVPDFVQDGLYLLNIQIASLQTDASPSKPLLFGLTQVS